MRWALRLGGRGPFVSWSSRGPEVYGVCVPAGCPEQFVQHALVPFWAGHTLGVPAAGRDLQGGTGGWRGREKGDSLRGKDASW